MIIHRRRDSLLHEREELPRGYTIAGYRIERLIGAGGMGAVYEATQLSLRRRVALKLIAAGVPIDATLRARFRREGHLQAVIDHPHILPVYEAGESRGRLFIAMRLVHGRTLKELVIAQALDRQRSMRIVGDVAHALDAAHRAGVLHRDVKPQNILVEPGDHAYLADFGLSKAPSEETLTRAGQLLGSIAYMSPEQVRGERATEASDIYSLTCVLYECLVGVVPFPRDGDHAILHAHVWEAPPRPSEVRPELPEDLDEVIARGMAKAPARRPRSACTLVQDARLALGFEPEAIDDEGVAAGAAPLAGDDDDSTQFRGLLEDGGRRSAALTSLLCAAALVGAVCVGYVIGPDSNKRTSPTVTSAADRTSASAGALFATDLNRIFSALNAKQASHERALARATTTRGQAKALAASAAAYREARTSVARANTPERARLADEAIGTALQRVAQTYERLESAARHARRGVYNDTKRVLLRREQDLEDAVQHLERLGYRLV